MNNKLLLLFAISIILGASCTSNDISTSNSEEKVKALEQKAAEIKKLDYDPYFTENKDIIMPEGPKSITRNILEDKQGNIWLATWNGVLGYDGKEYTNYTNKDSLRRHRVFSLLEDKSGNIWFGTIGAGLFLYNGVSFKNLTSKDGLVNDQVQCLYEDNSGKIWVGTTAGISVYDQETFTNYTTEQGLSDNDVNSIIQDKKGRYWIGTRGEACIYDGNNFTKIYRDSNKIFSNVRSIIKDKNQNIWLGGNNGLWKYKDDKYDQISSSFTGYIYEDQRGNIWTSSEASVGPSMWKLSKYPYDKTNRNLGAPVDMLEQENMFFGITEDTKGTIWLGTLNGVLRYNGKEFFK